MTIYLLDCIAFDAVHRRRYSFTPDSAGDWEHVDILTAWRVSPPEGTALYGRAEPVASVPGTGDMFSAESFKLAIEAGAVAGSIQEIPRHGHEKI